MQVFMTITVISILQTIFLYAYAPFQANLGKFQRYLLENFSNLLWDIPVILIMSYNHHLNYKILNIKTGFINIILKFAHFFNLKLYLYGWIMDCSL